MTTAFSTSALVCSVAPWPAFFGGGASFGLATDEEAVEGEHFKCGGGGTTWGGGTTFGVCGSTFARKTHPLKKRK
eukprot:9793987-Karenia_brevis.AAC.1